MANNLRAGPSGPFAFTSGQFMEFVAIGPDPALTGFGIRLSPGYMIRWRNGLGGTNPDIQGMVISTANIMFIGGPTNNERPASIQVRSATSIALMCTNGTVLMLTPTGLRIDAPVVNFNDVVVAPAISQSPKQAGTGEKLSISSQRSNSGIGGALDIILGFGSAGQGLGRLMADVSVKFSWNDNGVGFNGATPSKPTITSGDLASTQAALVSLGLVNMV